MHGDSLQSHRLYPGVPGMHDQAVFSPLKSGEERNFPRGKRVGSLLVLEN